MTLTPMQKKRQATLVTTLYRATEQRDEAIGLLVRREARLKQLRQQLARLNRIGATVPAPVEATAQPVPYQNGIALPSQSIDDPIPAFLDRRSEGDRKDAQARAAIEQEKAERDRTKAAGRKARAKARASGETRKMPLTGAAALAHIRSAG